jgi:hypothetical protein
MTQKGIFYMRDTSKLTLFCMNTHVIDKSVIVQELQYQFATLRSSGSGSARNRPCSDCMLELGNLTRFQTCIRLEILPFRILKGVRSAISIFVKLFPNAISQTVCLAKIIKRELWARKTVDGNKHIRGDKGLRCQRRDSLDGSSW